MNLKNKTPFIFIFLLFIVFLSMGIWRTTEMNKYSKLIAEIEGRLVVSEYNRLEYIKFYSPIYSHYYHNKSSIQETLEGKTSVLIYRFSKNICEICIHDDLQEIELLQKEVGMDKILLLPDYPDNRENRLILSNLLAKFNYLNLPNDSFLIPIREDESMQRYFAVIDKEGDLSMVFFPQRGEANITRHFFSEVKKAIFQ